MIDNVDVAVFTKLNELAERYRLKPYHFVSTFQHTDSSSGKMSLCFEVPSTGNALREERFDKMLRAIGVDYNGQLIGTSAEIIDALDRALDHSPQQRPR